MANNRMYLKCRDCGECFFLGKIGSSGYYLENYSEKDFLERLNEFYDKHHCCKYDKFAKIDNSVNYERQFTLAYDFLDNEEISVSQKR